MSVPCACCARRRDLNRPHDQLRWSVFRHLSLQSLTNGLPQSYQTDPLSPFAPFVLDGPSDPRRSAVQRVGIATFSSLFSNPPLIASHLALALQLPTYQRMSTKQQRRLRK